MEEKALRIDLKTDYSIYDPKTNLRNFKVQRIVDRKIILQLNFS